MNYFRLPNHIFDLGLKANELVVLTYLCSIHKPEQQSYVVARYESIAAACGYVSKVGGLIIMNFVPNYDICYTNPGGL